MINNMAKELKHSWTSLAMRASSSRDRNTAKVILFGQTVHSTRASFVTTSSTASVSMSGMIRGSTLAAGRIIRCMGRVSLNGLTPGATKVSTLRTVRKATAFSVGPMVDSTEDVGRLVSSTASEFLGQQRAKTARVSGTTVSASGGSTNTGTK